MGEEYKRDHLGGQRSERIGYLNSKEIRTGKTVVHPDSAFDYIAEVHPYKGLMTVTPKEKGKGDKRVDIDPRGWELKKKSR